MTAARTTLKQMKARHPLGPWTQILPAEPGQDRPYRIVTGCQSCQTDGPCDASQTLSALEAVLTAVDKPAGNWLMTPDERLRIVSRRVHRRISDALTAVVAHS